MALQKWAEALALQLQEQATSLSHDDIRKGLSDALNDKFPNEYCGVNDVYGDDQDGDVVYSKGGNTYKAPYSLGMVNGKRAHSIDTDNAKNVLPRTVYDEEANDADTDHMTAIGEALHPDVARMVFSERFVSKKERDAADSGSFAGKGKSFPILKSGDVAAAAHALGRAGSDNYSTDVIKRNIIRIAKAKGWTDQLPDAWKNGGDSKEARAIDITGDVIPLKEGAVGQNGSAYLKLIQPGWGSSGYYSRELLQRDGPTAFPKGTKNFWNHQTPAEESARPEGDLRDLASILTEDAHWEEDGLAGPGLYAKAEVQPHYRQAVDSLSKHIGVSIRANARAKEGKVDGKSGLIIEQLTKGISVDYVTTPGAGGQVLQLFEAARRPQTTNPQGEQDMTEAEVQRLIERANEPLRLENARLREQIGRVTAPTAIAEALESYILPIASKRKIITRLTEVGVDTSNADKLGKLVETEAKSEAAFLRELGFGSVTGLGTAPTATATDPKVAEAADAEWATGFKESMNTLADIFLDNKETTDAEVAKKRRKMFREGRAA